MLVVNRDKNMVGQGRQQVVGVGVDLIRCQYKQIFFYLFLLPTPFPMILALFFFFLARALFSFVRCYSLESEYFFFPIDLMSGLFV